MNVLELKEEDLEKLSDDELLKLHSECKSNEQRYNVAQLSKKVLINSLYGATGNQAFPLFNIFLASAITSNGRFFIQKLSNNIEKVFQSKIFSKKPYVTYNDTDSVYYQIEPFVDLYTKKYPDKTLDEKIDFCLEFAEKVTQPIIDQTIKDFTDDLNAYDAQFCGAKREIIADVLIHCAKKRYYGRIRIDEATRFPLDHPHIKVTGLEIVRSTTPRFTVNNIYQAIDTLFDKDETEIKKWLENIKIKFVNTNADEIALIGACTDLNRNLTDKALPIGVRASLIYNKFIQDNDLETEYDLIVENEKTKRLFLKTPNRFNSNIIAYKDIKFVKNYLTDIIDYDLMFEKGFLSALETMTSSLGYNLKSNIVTGDW